MTDILGTIALYDNDPGTEKTAPQILSQPSFDSRLYSSYRGLTYQCIRELRKDPTVQLARWAVLSPMIHTPWTYTNNKGLATQEMIDLVDDTFTPIRDQFLLQSTFGTLDYGWQPFEVVYKPEDGKIFIDSLKPLLHDFTTILVYLQNGKFAGFANETFGATGNGSEVVGIDYALNTNFEVEGTDWYGFSTFEYVRKILSSWDVVQESANRYDKKIAGATWVVSYPVGETLWNGTRTQNHQIAQGLISQLQASGAVAIPDEIQDWMDDAIDKEAKGKWRIELITAPSTTAEGFTNRQKYLDSLKMRAFALTERSVLEGSHGTKAEADVHGDVALSIVDSRHRLLCNHLNLGPVQRLLALNFGPKYRYAVCIKPAPLVDTQFATLKRIYELILSNSDTMEAEIANLDMKAIRNELGLTSSVVGTTNG